MGNTALSAAPAAFSPPPRAVSVLAPLAPAISNIKLYVIGYRYVIHHYPHQLGMGDATLAVAALVAFSPPPRAVSFPAPLAPAVSNIKLYNWVQYVIHHYRHQLGMGDADLTAAAAALAAFCPPPPLVVSAPASLAP
jgi:hypothetical protein